jgi:NusA-like KH domain protein
MSKIIYNADSLKIMTLFEKVTRTRLKDYFVDNNDLMTFVIDEAFLGKAIGKQASNVKKLEQLFKRKIRLLGFSNNLAKFVKNLIYPVKAEIEQQEKIVVIKANETKSKAMLIGRNQINLKNNLMIIKKYFKNIEQIKVE